MKRSSIADSIVDEWNRERYWKELSKRKKEKFKCQIDSEMQCYKCRYAENCLDKE